MRRYRAVLRHQDLRLLVSAFVIDASGTWASAIVLTSWVFEQTGSLVWLALLASTRWIPGLIAAPFVGVIADRYDRRAVLIASASANGLLTAVIAVVVAAGGPPGVVLALLSLTAIAGSLYRPAAGALTADVVDPHDLPTANSLLAAIDNVVVVVGPAIGAALVLVGSPAIGVAINAVSFLVAAGLTARLRTRSRGAGGRGRDGLRHVARGARAVRAAPTAGVLIAFSAIDTLLAWAYGVIYLPLSQHLRLGDGGYGLLLAAAAVGGLLGALVAERLSRSGRVAPVILIGVLLQSLPYACTAFTTNAVLGVGLQVVAGAGMVVVEVLTLLSIQRETPVGRLSSVLGLLDLVTLLASAVGGFVASAVLSAVPVPTALLLLGAGDALLALLLAPLLLRAERRASTRTAMLADRVATLEHLPLFEPLPRARLEALAAASQPRDLQPDEVLLREGDPADSLWVLVAGRLAVSSTATDRAGVAIPDVVAPDVVGEIGVLRALPRTATLTAVASSTLWRIDAEDYVESLSSNRLPRMMLGAPTARLARTHPGLADR